MELLTRTSAVLTCGGAFGQEVGLLSVQRLGSVPAGLGPGTRLHQALLLHQSLLLPPQILLLDELPPCLLLLLTDPVLFCLAPGGEAELRVSESGETERNFIDPFLEAYQILN